MAKHNEAQKNSDNELQEKVLYINRTAKVVTGGRRFAFSALILVGDGKGRVGYGFGKANELTDAIRKGSEDARRNIIKVEMEGSTIPHDVLVKSDGSLVLLKPAVEGVGIIAGSKVRSILELAGIRNIVAKNLGANNPINQVKATFKALLQLRSRQKIKESRGLI